MRRGLLVVAIAVLLCLCIASSQGASSKKKLTDADRKKIADLKLEHMRQRSASGTSAVVKLANTNEYKRYVHKAPRNYTVMLLAVAMAEQFKCESCRKVLPEFRVLANSFAAEHKDGEPEVFFAVIDYSAAPEVFTELGIQYTPIIYHVEPNMGKTKKSPVTKDDLHPFNTGKFDAKTIAAMLETHTGIQVDIVYPWPWGLILTVLSVGSATLYLAWEKIKAIPLWKIWAVVSLGVYFFFISGVMFTVIRGTPFLYRDPNTQEPAFVYWSMGSQFVAEAGIVAGLLMMGAFAVVKLNSNDLSVSKPAVQSVYALIYILLLYVSVLALHNIMARKNGGYPYRLAKPSSYLEWGHFYKSGPIRN